jgi:hypothetical protein
MINHWLIRVKNGKNFKNSKYPFWGVTAGKTNNIKTMVSKINNGDILWFLCNKSNDNKIISMATFTKFLDKRDEPLIAIETVSNIDQGWNDNNYELELHYKNLYNTEKQNIKIDEILGQSPIINYNNNKHKIKEDLEKHYIGFKFYGVPL